jgi:predicted MFS family arabinose efflux permease
MMLHDREEHRGGSIDWLGAITFAAAAALLLLGVNGTYPVVTLVGAAALATVFVLLERRVDQPLVDLSLLSNPVIGIGLVLNVLLGVMQFSTTTFVPPFAQGVLGRSPLEAGIALGAVSIGWPIGSTTTGWFLLRIGYRRAILAGSFVVFAGAAVLATLGPDAPLALLVLGSGIIGAGMGVTATPLLVGVQTVVAYQRRGIVTSLTNFSRSLGGAVGVATLGAVMNAAIGPRATDVESLLTRGARGPALNTFDTRDLLASGLHTVFLAIVVVAVVSLILATRLPAHDLAATAAEAA